MKKLVSLLLAMLLLTGCAIGLADDTEQSVAKTVADALGNDLAAIKTEADKLETNASAAIHAAISQAEAQFEIIKAHLAADKVEATEEVEAAYAEMQTAIASIKEEAAKLEGDAKTSMETFVKGLDVDFALAKMWIAMEAIEVSDGAKELTEKAKASFESALEIVTAEAAQLDDAAHAGIAQAVETIKTHFASLESHLQADKVTITDEAAALISQAALGIKSEFATIKDAVKTAGTEAETAITPALESVEAFFGHLINTIKGE